MIKVFEPKIKLNEKYQVLKSLTKNEISGTSNIIREFEENIANTFDRKFAVAVPNGSIALEISFEMLDLNEGDEVILPSFTIISCLSAILRKGLKPVFCDVDKNTWNMSLEDIQKVYTKNTKAILIVHTYGLTCDVKNIINFCSEKNLIIIEDAAEAHGQSFDEINCGSVGLISTLSFYANKHITAGEGGAVMMDSESLYTKAKTMINLGFNNKARFQHDNLYWNYRLSGLQASLGNAQLSNVNAVIEKKIKQGKFYNSLLSELEDLVQLPLASTYHSVNHYWVYGIVIKKSKVRTIVTSELYKKGIETRPFFWPLHLQNALEKKYKPVYKLNNSEYLGKNGFYIPIGQHVNKKKQMYIADQIKKSISKI